MVIASRNPKASLIWLNYNSSPSIETIKESLQGIANLQYDNFELIIVDNGSTDNSFKEITDFVQSLGITVKLTSANRNLGFTGGNNFGLRRVASDYRYVVLVNSDYVPFEKSLTSLISHMEQDRTIGEACLPQLDWEGKKVISAGHFLDEILNQHPRFAGSSPSIIPATAITYASGSYCIIRRDVIERLGRIFDENVFVYWEDSLLSIEVWNLGYKVMCFGELGGRHYGMLTSARQSSIVNSYAIKGKAYLLGSTNSRFKRAAQSAHLLAALQWSMYSNGLRWLNSYKEGLELAKKRKFILDLYKAPIKKSRASEIIKEIVEYPISRPIAYISGSIANMPELWI